ncbi:Rieske (2Fe-2S) protein [Halocatena marina]|uniref:Rieske (2Fe-2S) protein n=1 Tax=Halocatena marina TaxID=2934937 RepID=A0ABD5YSC9_9EURY|nr:Rieske 2Fe-2S domain-containing protein [Halocatena marina]
MDADDRIVSVDEVPRETTFLFTVRETSTDEERESILVRSNGEITGWLNYCQHFTHIRLDKGSGAEMRDDEIVCTNHVAMFEADTGRCTFGPCDGAYLEDIEITIDDGSVYLTDSDYEFVSVGPNETSTDLTSTSNIEF